jgi:hypothetical protein
MFDLSNFYCHVSDGNRLLSSNISECPCSLVALIFCFKLPYTITAKIYLNVSMQSLSVCEMTM